MMVVMVMVWVRVRVSVRVCLCLFESLDLLDEDNRECLADRTTKMREVSSYCGVGALILILLSVGTAEDRHQDA